MSRPRPGAGMALRTRIFIAARMFGDALPRIYGMGDVCRALAENDNGKQRRTA